MWEHYRRFLEAPPEGVFEWHDAPTGARGWLVINSLRGGAAGGGTRMRAGLGREEVVYLAKAMELKFAFSGPPIGGAKSGIDFDPADPRREGVLRRWFEAVLPFLRCCYGTAGDVNVDEVRDVVPICAELGVRHPQEGVVRGHLGTTGPELERALDRLRDGVRRPVDDAHAVRARRFLVSDLATGWGVARAAARLHELRGECLSGKRVVVEGFGNVGAATAFYLARSGARIVGLVDAGAALARMDGFEADEVESLLAARTHRRLPPHPELLNGDDRAAVYDLPADIFVPAAVSGSVDEARLRQLRAAGVTTLVCGANQPIGETHLGATANQEAADTDFEILPDVIGSQGMALAFHHLMRGSGELSAAGVFAAVGEGMDRAVDAVVDRVGGKRRGLLAAAVGIALERVAGEGAPRVRGPAQV